LVENARQRLGKNIPAAMEGHRHLAWTIIMAQVNVRSSSMVLEPAHTPQGAQHTVGANDR
jgi:hypothetical protein